MKTALLIMAAGIGSRFGGGIKQLATVDSQKHIIMDYSIHDAIAAGFNKIIFVIRRDIEQDFREIIGNRIEAVCSRLDVCRTTLSARALSKSCAVNIRWQILLPLTTIRAPVK